jgi:hypothetical protein
MPRGKRPTAHDELARLRDEAARANVNVRELSVEYERAKAVVDSAAGDPAGGVRGRGRRPGPSRARRA